MVFLKMSSQQIHDMSSYNVDGKPITQLKVDELKEELEKRGLKKSGVKKDLVERLCEDMDKQEKATEESDITEQEPTETEKNLAEEVEKEEKIEVVENEQQENENKNGQIEDGEILEEQKEPEKERKISLAKLKSSTTPVSSSRKRRWSSNKKSKSSVVISTDSLKELIPGVQLASTPALEAVMDFDDDKDEEEDEIMEEQEEKEKESEDIENKEDDQSSGKKTRIVQIEQSRKVRLKNAVSVEGEDIQKEMDVSGTDKDSSNITQGFDEEHEEQSSDNKFKPDRQVSPPRNAPSNILHVCNLVRPFTQKQLDQLLAKYGAIVEGGFWINKIKSHCYVTYSSIEEASVGRSGLHGQRWPLTSPKILNVDFADNDQMFEDTDGVLGKAKESEVKKEDEKQEEVEEKEVKVKEHKKHKEKKESKATDENAANLLDKLFRKTVTEPHIYWLPLTKEQIIVRDRERAERHKQRLAQESQLEKQKDERLREREIVARGKPEARNPVKAREFGRGEKEREFGRGKERETTTRGHERKPFRETPPQQRRSYDRRSPDVPRRRGSPPSRDNRGRR